MEIDLRMNVQGIKPQLSMRRCNTTLSRKIRHAPRRYCECCTIEYIRQLTFNNHMETENTRLRETMNVLGIQRSKSDLDVGSLGDEGMGKGFGLLRERSQIYLSNIPDYRRETVPGGQPREEVKVAKTAVPRKGMIQLSAVDEPKSLDIHGEKRRAASTTPVHSKLIKNKGILHQIQMGTKRLEEEEQLKRQEEEMNKSLGEYTVQDLQFGILELTDTSGMKRKTPGPEGAYEEKRKQQTFLPEPKQKTILPAIHTVNPFK